MPKEQMVFEHPVRLNGRDTSVKVRLNLFYETSGNQVTEQRIKYLIVTSHEDYAYWSVLGNEMKAVVEREIGKRVGEYFSRKGLKYPV